MIAAPVVLEVDLDAIVANWQALSARHPSGPVAGVVKADAYGLGAAAVAPALHAAGCRHFFVATLDEALAIRDLLPQALLGVLDGPLPGTEPIYHARDIVPVLGSLAEIDAWTAMGRTAGRPLSAILHVDAAELALLQQDHGRLRGLDLRYVMTHLVSAEIASDPVNEQQRVRFAAACAGLPFVPRSFANSSGIFLGHGWASALARPGAALYGINPTPGQLNPMRQTVRLRARVLAVRDVPAGTGVGYNATWQAERPSRIATAGIGYADGLHRIVSGRSVAFFDGSPVPLVGRVSMDLTTFDATDHPAIVPGTWLDVLGPCQTPDDLAIAAGTNGYEVLTSLARRVPRVYRPA